MASINIQGLKGLTAKDRQDWEIQQLSNIEGFESYSEEQKDRLYRNQEFKKTFGNNSNYEQLINLTPEQRDRYFANVAFKNQFSNNDDYESLTQMSPDERDQYYLDYDIKQQAESRFGKSQDWDYLKTLETPVLKKLIDQNYVTTDERKAFKESIIQESSINNTPELKRQDVDKSIDYFKGTDYTSKSTRLWSSFKKAFSSVLDFAGSTLLDAATDVVGIFKTGYEYNVINEVEGPESAAKMDTYKPKFFEKTKENFNRFLVNYRYGTVNDIYSNMLEQAKAEDEELKQSKVQEETNRIKSVYTNNYLSSDEGTSAFLGAWNDLISLSPYGQEFGNSYQLNIPNTRKAEIMATVNSMAEQYGDERAYQTLNNLLIKTIANNTTNGDKALNIAKNVTTQAVGVAGNAAMAIWSLGTGAIGGADTQENFLEGFTSNGNVIAAIFNPQYWESIAQYGTFDFDEIKRIKFGVGTQAYLDYRRSHPEMTDKEAEATWIKQQWEEGQFKGTQVSKHSIVENPEDVEDFFSYGTLNGALGMAGQVMGQAGLAKIFKGIGRAAKESKKIPKKYTELFEKGVAGASLLAPTLSIGHAYAQGVFEQTILKNRESLDNYLNTPEQQEAINEAWMLNKEYYDNMAKQYNPYASDKQLNQLSRQLAENDYRKPYYEHLTDGALRAYWTSAGIEALRYGNFNLNYRQWIYGDATRKLGFGKKNWSVNKNGVTNNLSKYSEIAKNFGKEAWNSGWTNYLDETTSAFATGIGTQAFNDYIGNYYNNNPEYAGIYGGLMQGIHSSAESFIADSSFDAFKIGALGFLLGGNFANVATTWMVPPTSQFTDAEVAERIRNGLSAEMTTKEARELLKQKLGITKNNYSTKRHILEWAQYLTGNSALSNISQQLQERDDTQRIVNELNGIIANNQQLLEDNTVANALFNFATLRERALGQDDEMVQKNAAYMQGFNLMRALYELQSKGLEGTQVYENVMQKFEELENGEITKEDLDSFINNPLNSDYLAQFTTQEEKIAYATERIQKNVAKFREIQESWKNNMEVLDIIFPNIQSATEKEKDLYYDTLFKMGLKDDLTSRLSSIEQGISGQNTPSQNSNSIVFNMLAHEGTESKVLSDLIEDMDKSIQEITIKLDKAQQEENLNDMLRFRLAKSNLLKLKQKYQERSSQLAQAVEEINQRQSVNEQVVSAEEILRLSPKERLFMLTHEHLFNGEQLEQIKQAQSQLLEKYGPEYLTQIRDAHIINERLKLNQTQIDNILSGNIQAALLDVAYMKVKNNEEAVLRAAAIHLNKLLPLLQNNEVTPDLIKATVGMPKQGLDTLKKLAPQYTSVLNNLQSILTQITFYDLAIDRLGLSNIEKEEATKVMFNILSKAKTKDDISRLLGEAVLDSLQQKKDLITSILKRAQEYVNLQNPVTETKQQDEVETKKEEKKEESKQKESKKEESKDKTEESSETSIPQQQQEVEEKPDMSIVTSLEEIILEKANSDLGKFITPTIEEEVKSNPQVKDTSVTSVTIPSADQIEAIENQINTQGTSMQGNWINGYNYQTLRKSGVQVATVGRGTGDLYNNYIEWMKANQINYQDVVDFELAALLEKNPKLPIRMLVTKGDENATHDNLIKYAILLVVEATPEVKKIHKEERSPYLKVGDKEYLVIGRAGLEREHTIAQSNDYNTMVSNINSRSKDYFEQNPTERFYVDTEYQTQVRYVNGGNLTKRLTTDSEIEQNRDVAEMLGDAQRDPLGFNKIENLAWGIQVGGEFRVFGLSENAEYYSPLNSEKVSGTVFIMIPIGNGKYIPAKINAAMTTTIKNGELKNRINTEFEKLVSPNIAVRREGIANLCKVLVLTDSSNILVGGEGFNTVTIIDNGAKTEYDLKHSNPQDVLEAIKRTPFRINIQSFTFTDPVLLKQYTNAGVFRTDLAVLSCTGNYYSVYSCDANGKPQTTTANVGNADYVSTASNIDSVVYNEGTYRYEDGQWTAPNGQKVISPTVIEILTYLKQIRDNDIKPVEQIKDNKGKAWDFYVISEDTNNPVVIREDRHGHAFKATKQQAIEYLKGYAKRQAKQQQEEAAKARLNEQLNQAETIDLFIEENKPQNQSQIQSQVQPQVQQQVQQSTPIVVPEAKPVQETKEVSQETVKKPILNLQESKNSINFAQIYDDRNTQNQFLDLIQEKFGDELPKINENASIEEERNDLVQFLNSKNIPVENITNFNSWLELIKNCR